MPELPLHSILTTRTAAISSQPRGSSRCPLPVMDARTAMTMRRNEGTADKGPNMMDFTRRWGIKALVGLAVAVSAGGVVAERSVAVSPATSTEPDSRPRLDVVHPRRATVAQRLQTNATLAAFEQADLFAKVTGYLSDVRVDIGDHVTVGQVLAVIDVPEMEKDL